MNEKFTSEMVMCLVKMIESACANIDKLKISPPQYPKHNKDKIVEGRLRKSLLTMIQEIESWAAAEYDESSGDIGVCVAKMLLDSVIDTAKHNYYLVR